MPLIGQKAGAQAQAKNAQPRIKFSLLLDQLDHEWQLLRQEDPASDHEAALRAYFHCSIRTALYWVNGDPYRFEPDYESFKQERLWKLCMYLRSLTEEQLKTARAAQLTQLRGPAWDNYLAVAIPEKYADNTSPLDLEVLPFTWEGIDTLWQTQDPVPADRPAGYLPKFACKASEDWHLVCLAVLFLNRACKYALSDLHPYPTGDGR
jgi:hypothetical protein